MPSISDKSGSNTARFDKGAANWDENAERKTRSLAIARAFGAIVDARGDRPDLFDYGCGTGQTCLSLAEKCSSVTGCDFSGGMLAKFMENATSLRVANARTLLCNLETEPSPNFSYDMVTCSMTLHHIEDVAVLVGKLASLLRPGGSIALVDLETEDGTYHKDNTGVKHYGFDKAQIVGFMKAIGLEDVRARTLLAIPQIRDGTTREYPVFIAQGTCPR